MTKVSNLLRRVYGRLMNQPFDAAGARVHALRESDIFLASYPRSGNTWVRVILANMILGPGALHGLRELDAVVPDIHRGVPPGDPPALPRVIKTHQPFAFRHESHRAELYRRVIYVVRNPVDSILSYHEFLRRSEPGFATPLEHFAHDAVNGAVHPGSWNEHVLSWTHLKGREVLVIKYEDLRAAPLDSAAKMAAFIGKSMNEKQLADVLAASDLKAMRALDESAPLVPGNKDFVRADEAGRKYDETLSEETRAFIFARSAEAMKELGYSPQ